MKRRRRLRRRRKVPEPVTILALVSLVATLATVIIQLATPGPTVKSEGPRLSDKTISVSTYGDAIPVGAGRARFGTNMIWSTGIQEVRTTRKDSLGKGGSGTQKTTTYSYYVSAAFSIAGNEATALCRVWADSKLIYDNSVGNTSGITWKYSQASITFYKGSETQFPDPLIQQHEGVGKTPAYRGQCYFVVGDLPLADFGNRVPQITAEVVFDSTQSLIQSDITTFPGAQADALGGLTPIMNRATRHLIHNGSSLDQLHRYDMNSATHAAISPRTGASLGDIGDRAWVYDGNDLNSFDWGEADKGVIIRALWHTSQNRAYVVVEGSGAINRRQAEINTFGLDVFSSSGDVETEWRPAGSTSNGSIVSSPNSTYGTNGSQCSDERGLFGTVMASHTDGANTLTAVHIIRFRPPSSGGNANVGFPTHGGERILNAAGNANRCRAEATVSDAFDNFWVCGHHLTGLDNAIGSHASLWRVKVQGQGVSNDADGLDVEHFDLAGSVLPNNGLRVDCHEPSGLVYDASDNTLLIFGTPDSEGKATWVQWSVDTQSITGVVVIPSGANSWEYVSAWGWWHSLQKTGTARGIVILGIDQGSAPGITASASGFVEVSMAAVKQTAALSLNASLTQSELNDGSYREVDVRAPVSRKIDPDDTLADISYRAAVWHPEADVIYMFNNGGEVVKKIELNKCTSDPISLTTIIERVMAQGQLVKNTDYELVDEATAFDTKMVEGYRISRQMPVRKAIEPLAFAYLFDVVESDFILKFRARDNNALAATIPEADLGVRNGPVQNGEVATKLLEHRIQEIELPERVDVTFMDKDRDHQKGSQYAKRQVFPNPTQYSRNNITIELPVAIDTTQAQTAAEINLFASWLGREMREWVLGPKWLLLDGADLVDIIKDNITFQTRITSTQIGEGYALGMAGVRDAIETYTANPLATFDPISSSLEPVGATEMLAIDVPYLRDQDDAGQTTTGLYVAFGAYLDSWRGALAQASEDGALWETVDAANDDVPWGYLNRPIAAVSAPNYGEMDCRVQGWDREATIDLYIVQGVSEIESASSDLSVLGGANAIAVNDGSRAEIIQFKTVTVLDANTVRVSELLRGRRGTEQRALTDHPAGTRWFLLDPPSDVTRVQVGGASEIGTTRHLRAISSGEAVVDVATTTITFTGADLKPLSPCHVRSDKIPGTGRSGDLAITWTRRTRFGGNLDWLDAVTEVPIAENAFPNGDTERYELVLLDKTDNTIESVSKVVSTESATLTETERTDAGYTAGEEITVTVYQHSAEVGRGHPMTTVI